jgi:branched-chain amino acid transport system ATP-binding protein
MAELLRVENLSAGYGEARVIHGVSFAVEDGQSLALLGRNSVGKTILIDSLVGVTPALAGEFRWPARTSRLFRHTSARGAAWAGRRRNATSSAH